MQKLTWCTDQLEIFTGSLVLPNRDLTQDLIQVGSLVLLFQSGLVLLLFPYGNWCIGLTLRVCQVKAN